MKNTSWVRTALPKPIFTWLRSQKHRINIVRMYLQQASRFTNQSAIVDRKSLDQLSALLIFFSHRLEKGLSHSDFRPGFGCQAIIQLYECLSIWLSRGYTCEAFEFRLAVAALKSYQNKHLALGLEPPEEYKKGYAYFSDYIDAADTTMSGIVEVRCGGEGASYYDTLRKRHSIREYAPGKVDADLVVKAIDIAMSAPSVCNRQSQRVTIIESADKIRKVLDAQGGWRGYAYPPTLLIVTSSLASFISSTERNEPYVDGGIFTMALLGALEWVGLAACPLNAMFEMSNESAIREITGLPDGEAAICIITVGKKPESVLCPRSARKDAADVIRYA